MITYSKKGSVTLEAAILLPVMIVGILTLAYLIKIIYFQEVVFHALVNEARKTSTEAYLNELEIIPEGIARELIRIGPQNILAFESRLKENLFANSNNYPVDIKISQFRYLFSEGGINDLINIKLSYVINLSLPIGYVKKVNVTQGVLMRAWTGNKDNNQPMPFGNMEIEEPYNLAFIFPRAGDRYHVRDCSYVANEPSMEILNDTIRKSYKPCELCDASEKTNGSAVFCFKEYGTAYHSSKCPSVDKYIIEIEISEAEAQGFQKCTKCGGVN